MASSKKRAEPTVLAAAQPSRGREALPVLALAGLVALTYGDALTGPLLRDSRTIIPGDPRVQALSLHNLALILQHGYWWPSAPFPLYRPLTTLTYLLNWVVLGNQERPLGYHVFNVLLHWANSALLYGVALRLARPGGLARGIAFVAAALFAVHPIETEAVTYVVGRADELVGFALLAGLLAHLRAQTSSGPQRRRWLVLLGVLALVADFSKESGLLLVGVLVLHDALFNSPRRNLASYLATLPAGALFLLFRFSALRGLLFAGWPFVDDPLVHATALQRTLTAAWVFSKELRLLVFPGMLSCDYSYRAIPVVGASGTSVDDALAAVGMVAALTLLSAAISARKHAPEAAFGALFFMGTLLPTSNLLFPTGSIFAERFLYVPSLGFSLLVTAAVGRLLPQDPARSWLLSLAKTVTAGVTLALLLRTHARNANWRDDLSLWTSTAAAVPESFRAQGSLARAAFGAGTSEAEVDAALEAAERSVAILERPILPLEESLATPYTDLGHYLRVKAEMRRDQGQAAEADALLNRAWDVLQHAHEIGQALFAKVQLAEASKRPLGDSVTEMELFATGADLQRWPEATAAIDRAAALAPLDPAVHQGTARARLTEGDLEGAAVALVKGLIVDGNNPRTWVELQRLYGALGAESAIHSESGQWGFDRAHPLVRKHLNRACNELIAALVAMGSLESAQVLYRRAIDPSDLACPRDAVQTPPPP